MESSDGESKLETIGNIEDVNKGDPIEGIEVKVEGVVEGDAEGELNVGQGQDKGIRDDHQMAAIADHHIPTKDSMTDESEPLHSVTEHESIREPVEPVNETQDSEEEIGENLQGKAITRASEGTQGDLKDVQLNQDDDQQHAKSNLSIESNHTARDTAETDEKDNTENDADDTTYDDEPEGVDDSEESESDGDERESDESDSDSDDDGTPPTLKYTRLSKLPAAFYSKDAISCCLYHPSVIVYATHSGVIHMMKPDYTPLRTFRAHKASILSIHTDGEYVLTGSMDGTVVIGSISNQDDIVAVDFKRPIHAVVLEGSYALTKTFVVGGTSSKVILSTKNWLGQRADTTLDEGNGTILNIQIFGDLLIYFNDSGINFYQLNSRSKIYQIKLPTQFPRPDLYWPKIQIMNNNLLIGWANNIWSVQLIDSVSNDSRSILSSGIPERRIHIDKHIQLKDTLIAGISFFKGNYLVLNFIPSLKGQPLQPPELKTISGITLDDLSVDEVELKNFTSLGLNDYSLVQTPEGWALVSANDVILVEESTDIDKLEFYIENEMFLKAWEICGPLLDDQSKYDRIASKQLSKYADASDWTSLAQFLLDVCQKITDSSLVDQIWTTWIPKFIEAEEFDVIVDHVPSNLQERGIYDSFLNHFFQERSPKLIDLIKRWNHELFSVQSLNDKLDEVLNNYDQGDQDQLESRFAHDLRLVHIDLSIELQQYSHAALHLFKSKDPNTLSFLSDHHLLHDFFDKIPDLITIDISKDELKYSPVVTLESRLLDRVVILIANRHELLPNSMLELFKSRQLDVVSFFYLRQLFDTPGFITTPLEDELVKLYTEFDPSNLLPILQKFKNYNIEIAIQLCESKNLVKELVFLYSEIGQNKKALDLIIKDLKDPQHAIKFASSLGDSDLFEHLIEYSSDKPPFIKLLIIEAGYNKIDPKKIISRVPNGTEIENLRQTLITITSNNNSELFIHNKILKIIEDETMKLIETLNNMRLQGLTMDPEVQTQVLDGETLIRFYNDEKIYKESDLLGDSVWTQVSRSISDKIKHFIYIKKRKSI